MHAEEEIAALEEEWMQAWVRKDLVACARILADDFQLTSARGMLMPKAEWLAAAGTAITATRFAWESLQVRLLDHDVALVHGRSQQEATAAGQDWSGMFLVSDVWVRRNGRWQVVARHGTGPLR